MQRERRRIRVTGIVQGVGFRPHTYALARRLGIAGFIANDSLGVTIEAEATTERIDCFLAQLRESPPPHARIERLESWRMEPAGSADFEIHTSAPIEGESTPVSPDLATCADCLAELFDPSNRRYRYPFLNCTNCGPRFTIVRDIPYDRRQTTMSSFQMCTACEREYHDPLDRRFHAQPNACPECGPQLRFHPGGSRGEAALAHAMKLLAAGEIVAVKGIGGFHLACDAANGRAVEELRRRKGRVGKPFALMVRDLAAVRRFARVSEEEARLLESRERPIVLLRQAGVALPESIAPGHSHLGFLLPYSPLHHLLVGDSPLVMTSGNRSDEPIARSNSEAQERLQDLAGGFLLHDREIHAVCDDSVVRAFQGREMPIRRSRGYAPMPLRLAEPGPSTLAVGAELKSTFCLTRDERAYISQHIGDMENVETLQAFEHAFEQMRTLFRVEPECVACDLHPGYLSTRWAREFAATNRLLLTGIQHHHAHVASLMAECGLDGHEPILGVAFDGTGYGTDGAVWGGELLLADYRGFRRLTHLKYVPMPGGDAAIRRPYRMALAHLRAAGVPWDADLPCVQAASEPELAVLSRDLNCVATSSIGRLFDAAASLVGLRHNVSYEAQGAMEFEAAADPECCEAYTLSLEDPSSLWRQMIVDMRHKEPLSRISARFHRGLARAVTDACVAARHATGVAVAGLTGGVFQNTLLTGLVRADLESAGFRVLTHRLVPPNDGGLALGQAAVALSQDRRVE